MHPEDPLASTRINWLRGLGKHKHESVMLQKCVIFCHPKKIDVMEISSSFEAETACYCRSGLYTLEQGRLKEAVALDFIPQWLGFLGASCMKNEKAFSRGRAESTTLFHYFIISQLKSWLITLQVSTLSMAQQYQLLALLTKQSNFKIPDPLACPLFKACISRAPLKLWLLLLQCQHGGGRVRKRCPAWERVLLALAMSDLHAR